MSPRPYSMEKREAATSETRLRILEAARQILGDESEDGLSMGAIARRADVSRLTVYYQFKSRPGLLEALYDQLAARGNMRRMAEVFHEPDPYSALDKMASVFIGFWSSDRVVIRRLRALATLDPEIAKGIESRDERRRQIAIQILRRITARQKTKYDEEQFNGMVSVVTMLTGFASYDALASAGHSEQEIIAIIARLARLTATSLQK